MNHEHVIAGMQGLVLLMQGRPYGPIFKFFPDAIVLGVCNPVTGQCDVNPAASRIIEKGDHLVLMRPTNVSQRAYGPSRKAVVVSPGEFAYMSG